MSFGNPRCQCGERRSAHPDAAGHAFRQRLNRRTPLKSSGRKSRHSSRRSHLDELAQSLGLRRSRTMGAYKRRLWGLVSEYRRRQDADPETGLVKCISCPTVKHWKEMDCGHYLPKSLGMGLYFAERNVAPQCPFCNLTLQGNQYAYALALIARHGPGIIEELEALRHSDRQIKEPEYLELISQYQKKLEDMKGGS